MIPLQKIWRRLRGGPPQPERLMHRFHLFEELTAIAGPEFYKGKRILEIGPKDGCDSKRLAALNPSELVMIDLPEKVAKIREWLPAITAPYRFLEANFMYLNAEEYASLGTFDLIWCTGVLYHNSEQLRFLRKLFRLLNPQGRLVLESATLRGPWWIRNHAYVEVHYPKTYRNTGTITHLPTAAAIRAWLAMVGFSSVIDSRCFAKEDRQLLRQRYACIAHRSPADKAGVYYGGGANPEYHFGDSA